MLQTFNVNKNVFGGSRNVTHILAIVSKRYGLKVDSGYQLVGRVLGGLLASLGESKTKYKLRAIFQPHHLHPVRRKTLVIDSTPWFTFTTLTNGRATLGMHLTSESEPEVVQVRTIFLTSHSDLHAVFLRRPRFNAAGEGGVLFNRSHKERRHQLVILCVLLLPLTVPQQAFLGLGIQATDSPRIVTTTWGSGFCPCRQHMNTPDSWERTSVSFNSRFTLPPSIWHRNN
ncbi:hypothetical protein E2C01_047159 [Portunus trituberculatus]|uniref:Uncharacterized protein n=1 Tax=Portunus trituberculatus TaxID=210409 RepID=A0A5B7G0E3_PORTR|nr:hypothetical protein [Portunus trituberculatus]